MEKVGGRRSSVEARGLWSMHVSAQVKSGLSAAQYCVRHDICVASFYQWRTRLSREATSLQASQAGSFREIVTQPRTAGSASGAAIEISSVRIRLTDERLLGQVLGALMGS